MIKKYVKRVPDQVEAVIFSGKNYPEINQFLQSKGFYSELIVENFKLKIVFFGTFDKTAINVHEYAVYDPVAKSIAVMDAIKFKETYADLVENVKEQLRKKD